MEFARPIIEGARNEMGQRVKASDIDKKAVMLLLRISKMKGKQIASARLARVTVTLDFNER